MEGIAEQCPRPLRWRRTDGGHYELLCDDRLVAALSCDAPCGLQATGQTARSRWLLACANSLESRYVVRPVGGLKDLAVALPCQDGSTLRFSDGRTFRWRRNSRSWMLFARASEWSWTDAQGRLILTVKGLGQADPAAADEAEVTLAPGTGAMPELELLLLMGWYLLLVQREEQDAVMAALMATAALTEGPAY